MNNSNYNDNSNVQKPIGYKHEFERVILEGNCNGFILGVSGSGRAIRGSDGSKSFSEHSDYGPGEEILHKQIDK